MFTDVDRPGTSIAYYDAQGRRLAKLAVPVSPGNETLSFLGARFHDPRVARVRITSGSAIAGQNETDRRDVVVSVLESRPAVADLPAQLRLLQTVNTAARPDGARSLGSNT